MAEATENREIKWGIIGYGGAFNMGLRHASWINSCPAMRTTAVCDVDPARVKAAQDELPGVKTYSDYREMLRDKDVDSVVVILPHNMHYPVSMDALAAGKGVCMEKPFCIKTEEATAALELAREKGLLLTVFHNRRRDGDFMAVKEFIDQGMIGDVFRVETFMGGWDKPPQWWRSSKEVSGGTLYDWGAHGIDWTLQFLAGRKIKSVTGVCQRNRVWSHITNEDEVQAIVRFDDDVVADITVSSIAKARKPRWRILGTKGAIVDWLTVSYTTWNGTSSFKAYVDVNGYPAEMDVNYKPSAWETWYPNLADHLLRGKELEVKPEEARRVTMIMDYAERSALAGGSIETPFE